MRFVKNDCRPNCWKRHHAKYRLKRDSMVQFNIEWSKKNESKFGKYKLQAPDEQDDAGKDRQDFRCGEKHHEWQFSGKSYSRMCQPVHASVMKPSSSRCSAMPGRRTVLQYWP